MRDSRLEKELQRAQREASSVYAVGGRLVGELDALFYDVDTGVPEWIRVRAGFPSSRRVLVPAERARVLKDGVHIPYSEEQITGAPEVADDEISDEDERSLIDYYDLAAPATGETQVMEEAETRIDTTPAPEPLPAGDTGETASVTRSEEELIVGKRTVEAGRVRLRKWVETEPVAAEVELEHEVVHVVREPVDVPVEGVELGEQEIEVPVYAEQPEVEKEVVAKERVLLDKDVETDVEVVEDELRVERVEVETPGEDRVDTSAVDADAARTEMGADVADEDIDRGRC